MYKYLVTILSIFISSVNVPGQCQRLRCLRIGISTQFHLPTHISAAFVEEINEHCNQLDITSSLHSDKARSPSQGRAGYNTFHTCYDVDDVTYDVDSASDCTTL